MPTPPDSTLVLPPTPVEPPTPLFIQSISIADTPENRAFQDRFLVAGPADQATLQEQLALNMGRLYAQQWAATLLATRQAQLEQRALTAWKALHPIGPFTASSDWVAGFVAGALSSSS